MRFWRMHGMFHYDGEWNKTSLQRRAGIRIGGTGMVDTSVRLGNIQLENPVIPASGTFAFGYEFADFYDINMLGAIVIKGLTSQARYGNPQPRIAECPAGMLNAIGLQNPGVDQVIGEEIPKLRKCFEKPIIANVSGFSVEEYVECCEKLDQVPDISLLEINISCPNVKHGGMSFGTDPESAAEVVKSVKKVTKKPVFIKLTPNITDITLMAKACEDAGADGLTLINTLMGMRIDLNNRSPLLANKTGGYSGKGVFPIAVRMVYQVYEAVQIPVIGVGGISGAEDHSRYPGRHTAKPDWPRRSPPHLLRQASFPEHLPLR